MRISRPARKAVSAKLAVAAICMSGGLALVTYFVAKVSLVAAFGALLVVTTTTAILAIGRLTPDARRAIFHLVKVGLVVGFLATLGYDLVRWAYVAMTGSEIRPFDAWPMFGSLLTGSAPDTLAARIVGIGYHYANGVGFGVAYCVLLGRRGVVAGIAFALCLEAAMLTFYPGWLDIRAIREFTSVSLLGHLVYGALLGAGCRRALARPVRGFPRYRRGAAHSSGR